jgi:hypothetical protein
MGEDRLVPQYPRHRGVTSSRDHHHHQHHDDACRCVCTPGIPHDLNCSRCVQATRFRMCREKRGILVGPLGFEDQKLSKVVVDLDCMEHM